MGERNPRINVGLPDGILGKLKRYAQSRTDNPSAVAAYLLTRILDDLEEQGKIPPQPPSDITDTEALELLIGFLNSLIKSGTHNGYSLAEIAEILGHSNDTELIDLVEKIQNSNPRKERAK